MVHASSLPRDARIFVAGHRGLVGSAIIRRLQMDGFPHILTAGRNELDLRDQRRVRAWFQANQPDYIFMCAAVVGGIHANETQPAQFLHDNLVIAANVLEAANITEVKKLLFLGSSCIYPRCCPQPIREEYLLSGPLEPTNEAYAIAKIAGVKLCQAYRREFGRNFISAMPTNVYGPGDNFDLEGGHAFPAMIRRFHEATLRNYPAVTVWGTGNPRREFIHADDLADACLLLMRSYDDELPINIGTGEDLTIRELAEKIRDIVAPGMPITFDYSRSDGTPRKLLDVSRLHALGWHHRIGLEEGIRSTYSWFRDHYDVAIQRRPARVATPI